MKKGPSALVLALFFPVLLGTSLRAVAQEWPSPVAFLNGNVNGDDRRDVSDAVYILQYLFQGGPSPVPLGCGETQELSLWLNGDTNGDWRLDLSDAVYLLSHLFLGGPEPVDACYDGEDPPVLPPDARPYGLSYGEWGARWWQWVLSMPCDEEHPVMETDGVHCARGQSGPVFFLGGTFGDPINCEEPDPKPRFCTVPFGKSIFFPLITAECSTVEGWPFDCVEPPDGGIGCVECAEGFSCSDDTLTCTIDGEVIDDLLSFRAASPVFEFAMPAEDNCLGVPGITGGLAATDGYWIFLAPLPRGDHQIEFTARWACGPSRGFSMRVCYTLIVE